MQFFGALSESGNGIVNAGRSMKDAPKNADGKSLCHNNRSGMSVQKQYLEESDSDLMAKLAKGDRSAATMLAKRYGSIAYAQAFRVTGNQADAEEIAQEALIKMWQQAPDWQNKGAKLSSWLYIVISRLATDRFRKQKNHEPLEEAHEIQEDSPGREAELQRKTRAKALHEALETLPPRQREAIRLRHLEDESHAHIAEIMELSIEAVESLISRGRKKLSEKLGARDELGEIG